MTRFELYRKKPLTDLEALAEHVLGLGLREKQEALVLEFFVAYSRKQNEAPMQKETT